MVICKRKSQHQKRPTPWSPAITLCFALDTTLDLMLQEGLPHIFARHARVAQMTRDGVKSLGLSLFARESHASNTVTAVCGDDRIDVPKLIKVLHDEYNVNVAGGQKRLSGKIFRIGHLGLVDDKDIEIVLEALAKALTKVGS